MPNLTYEYKVTAMKVRNEGQYPEVVVQTYWTLTGTDEQGNSGTFIGATPFTYDPSQSPFVPYNELTQADVIGWISAVVDGNPDYKQHIQAQIAKQIANEIDPVTEPPLPWDPNPPEPTPPGPQP